jgi:hypothetical protein
MATKLADETLFEMALQCHGNPSISTIQNDSINTVTADGIAVVWYHEIK